VPDPLKTFKLISDPGIPGEFGEYEFDSGHKYSGILWNGLPHG
jgi:hypothetical protein